MSSGRAGELFCQGNWQAAAEAAKTALAAGQAQEGVVLLYAAARLLAAAAAQKGGQRARLARCAAVLDLPDAERAAAVSFSVDANLAVKNYG